MRHTTPRVYYYTDDEVGTPWAGPDADRVEACKRYGYRHPRFIWYEWPGFGVTTDPVRADVFVVRQRFSKLSDQQMRGLPYLRGNEARHVFFDLNDQHVRTFPDIQGIFLRSCRTRAMLAVNPGIVLWPWAVMEKLVHDHIPLPEGGFEYDAVYQGQHKPWIGAMIDSLGKANLKTHLVLAPTFWPSLRDEDPDRYRELRRSYLATMSAGRLILCPMTNDQGATRIRLFEAMAMGRFQVRFNDRAMLSFGDKIDWDKCLLQLPMSAIGNLHEILPAWLAEHSDEEIIERGRYARRMWQKWLAPERWGRTAGIIVRERLGLGWAYGDGQERGQA